MPLQCVRPEAAPTRLAEFGFDAAIGSVTDVWRIAPLEAIGNDVVPAVAAL